MSINIMILSFPYGEEDYTSPDNKIACMILSLLSPHDLITAGIEEKPRLIHEFIVAADHILLFFLCLAEFCPDLSVLKQGFKGADELVFSTRES